MFKLKFCGKSDRYRINRRTHNKLVANNGGYVFVNGGMKRVVSAKGVSSMLKGNWHRDRSYYHKFLSKKKVFR